MLTEEQQLEQALRRQAQQARADYRAGKITLADCAHVTRSVRETLGEHECS